MDRWLPTVHAMSPVKMVTNHVGDSEDPWHRFSVESFEGETQPFFVEWFRSDAHAALRNPELDARIATLLRNAARALFEADALTKLSSAGSARLVPTLEAAAKAAPLIEDDLLEYAAAARGT
jgi:hypothetical protein